MANNDNRMLVQGATARHDAIAKMKRMLTDINNIRKTLTDLKMEVEKFQQDINISKTVGTATNAVGVGLAIGMEKPSMRTKFKMTALQDMANE
jgi:hypothetical protein